MPTPCADAEIYVRVRPTLDNVFFLVDEGRASPNTCTTFYQQGKMSKIKFELRLHLHSYLLYCVYTSSSMCVDTCSYVLVSFPCGATG